MSNHSFLSTAAFLLSAFSLPLVAAGQSVAPSASPVEVRIADAQAKVKVSPNSAASYNDLAAALCRKGRDAEDLSVYEQAEAAVNQSLRLTKDNYEARKLHVQVLLGKQELVLALQLATELNRKVPDDLAVWASLVDANIALGNYAEAEKQAQWVLDLRPGNTLGFEKSAALREAFGDVPGAIEFWDEANRRTSSNDTDEHAWLLTQKARLQLESGYDKEAEAVLQQAFQLFPESQLATEVLARIRLAQGKFNDAAVLFEKRFGKVKSASNLYDWAQALDRGGQKAEAAKVFERFNTQAQAEAARPFNANRQLVFFDINQKHDPAAALALATRIAATRHDCATLDAYAWALFSNGKVPEAKTQMDRALAVGIRDPQYFCHAAQIAAKAGDPTAAANYQKEVATLKGSTCAGDHAQGLATQISTSAVADSLSNQSGLSQSGLNQ